MAVTTTAESSFINVPTTDDEVMEDMERITRNAKDVQVETLLKILERNGHVEYLQRHGLNRRTDEASFKACLPVITFAAIQDDVDRIASGADRAPILCADPVRSFSLSSGTSGGKSKMIPSNDSTMQQVIKAGKIGSLFRRRAFPRTRDSEKPVVMMFGYAGRQFVTKSGLKAGTDSTNTYRSPAFKNGNFRLYEMSSPFAVVLGYDVAQQMYCHLLGGLYRSQEVEMIGAIFAYMIVEPFRLLEQVWRNICTDIREGTVNERVSDPEIRAAVEEILSPNPELADFIERECAKGWSGIVERVFPNLLYIISNFSGSMLPYIARMRQYAGSVPLVNGDYGSTESWIGINLDCRGPTDNPSYTIIPDFAYFEFIPVSRDSAGSEFVEDTENIVGLTDIEVGHEYEIVLTTNAGLYRYRQGDILRVTGFYNSTPKVAFVCRKGVVLSVNSDKTDEEELRLVVENASRQLKKSNMEILEFSSCADHESQPGHYLIFLELRSREHLDVSALNECCAFLDRSFNNRYMMGRAARTIGPLELAIVKEGAFARLMDQFVRDTGIGASQYKTPRCITNPLSLKLLRDETIFTARSPEFPGELLAMWRPSANIVG